MTNGVFEIRPKPPGNGPKSVMLLLFYVLGVITGVGFNLLWVIEK